MRDKLHHDDVQVIPKASNLDEELDQITKTVYRIGTILSSAAPIDPNDGHITLLVYLLNSQHEDGSWGSGDYPIWKPIMTAEAIEALMRSGLTIDSEWEIRASSSSQKQTGGIKKACEWLITAQYENGGWGEDFWESCQVMKTMFHAGYSLRLPALQKGIDYLRRVVSEEWKAEEGKEWFGPAFHATGAEVFSILRDQVMVDSLVEKVWKFQDSLDGKFCSPLRSGGHRFTTEWHTAIVIVSLSSVGIPVSSPKLMQAFNWLKSVQAEDGSWGQGIDWVKSIFVLAATVACAIMEGPQSEAVKKGIKWYLDRQEPNGRVRDINMTCNAAMAFSLIFRNMLYCNLPFNSIIDTLALIQRQHTLIDTIYQEKKALINSIEVIAKEKGTVSIEKHDLEMTIAGLESEGNKLHELVGKLEERTQQQEKELETLRRRLSSYWVHLTDKQIALIGLLIGFIGLIVAILTIKPF